MRYVLDSEQLEHTVSVAEARGGESRQRTERADPSNPYQLGSPSAGDLWVMLVKPGDLVHRDEEVFNVSIMKQEKAVLAPVDGVEKRVLKYADYQADKKMVPVREGELLVELAPVPAACPSCEAPLPIKDPHFCPSCGHELARPVNH